MKRTTRAFLWLTGGVAAAVGGAWAWAKANEIPPKAGKTYTPPGNTFQQQIAFCKAASRDPTVGQNCLAWLREVGIP